MSGGTHDFAYRTVEDEASLLKKDRSTYRRAFATHLELVAKALHSIEWVDSGDYGPGDDKADIMAVINPSLYLSTLIEEAAKIRDELSAILKKERR